MTETEKLFQELFPDLCAGDKCLSPYFDIFDTAMELNENKIRELQEQIEKMKSDIKDLAEQADKNGDMLALKRMSELFKKWG